MNKIIDYDTFKKVHMPDSQQDKNDVEVDVSDTSNSGDEESLGSDSEVESEDDEDETLNGFVVPDDIFSDEDEIDDGEEGDDEAEKVEKLKRSKSQSKKEKRHRKSKKAKGKEKEDPKKMHLNIAQLKREANRTVAGRKKYFKYLRKNYEPSTKILKTIELLERFQKEGRKTIIFSQFVSLLDLLQIPIEKNEWEFERYDGSMSSEKRNDAIVRFTDNPNTKIMLISLKAGNAGLNLVAASRVIIFDPFWNPFIEMQAVDRAYRIGQLNSVEVHRVLVQNTVEDRIIELQEQKRKLVESALDENAAKSLGRLGVAELGFLFGVDRRP